MKRRICFVDDEPQALDLMRKATAAVGGIWDCAFVPSGEDALSLLAEGSFDAVVTNIRLPRIDGIQLLQEVGRLQPNALRFIVGDVADQGVVLNCLGGTHQFIAKPCPAEALVSIVQRSLALDSWLSTEQLRKLVPRLQRLPSLPSTYFELLMQIESPHASADLIAEVISRDPAATARLLQVVNSAALALRRKITDTSEAVAQLGVETVKSIVLCVQVFDPHEHKFHSGFSFDALWAHSLSVATIARNLVMRLSHDNRAANEAFTAGLLHDVGRIVLASNLPDEYSAIIAAAKQNHTSLEAEEAAQLGVTHAQVGAYLLGLWGMPAHLVESTALHHTPDQKLSHEFAVLTAVHIANVLAHATEPETNSDALTRPELNAAYLKALNLPASLQAWQAELAGEVVHSDVEQSGSQEASAKSAQPKSDALIQDEGSETLKPGWLFRFAVPGMAVALVAAWVLIQRNHAPVMAKESAKSPSEQSISTDLTQSSQSSADEKEPEPKDPTPPPSELTQAQTSTTLEPLPASTMIKPQLASVNAPLDAPKPPDSRSARPKSIVRGFGSLKVQAIFYQPDKPRVMINGNMFNRGDLVNDVRISAIAPSGVTLTCDGEERVVRIE